MGVKYMMRDVRLSFLTLGEPEQYDNKGPFRWSATALIPYDSMMLKEINKIMDEVASQKWEKKASQIMENIRSDSKLCCLTDGKRKDYDGYAGHWALAAHRMQKDGRPLVMDNDKSPIYKPDDTIYEGKGGRIFSGSHGNMQVEFWAQDNSNGKGIRATLLAIQRVRTGDAFGGGSAPVADDFAEIADGADADDLG